MKTLLTEEMTSPHIRKAIQAGYRRVIVAAGSIEQHGKHLPTGTDSMLGYELALEIARGLGNTLVAPVIRPGCSDHHMTFSGTISIPPELLQGLCRAYCHCLAQHGFEEIVLISAHGGNNSAMEAIAPVINAELPCKVVWVSLFDSPEAEKAQMELLQRYGISPAEGGVHAGFTETSELLASPYGKWADMSVAERGFVGDAEAEITKAKAEKGSWNIADISPIGVLGDATKGNAEAGMEMVRVFAPFMVEMVRTALA
jgi:creatinine amidohydrolase